MNPNNRYINRMIERQIQRALNKGKVIIIYGPRQAGKTTLVKNIFQKLNRPFLYLPCEETRVREQLIPDSLVLKKTVGRSRNIVFDEAQKLENPGLILKVLIDNYPGLNIIASGSSSFDLANKLNEPLTGRHFEFRLFPLSYPEIAAAFPSPDLNSIAQDLLIYGSYPETFKLPTKEEKINYLTLLAGDYLYKDILVFNLVKNSRKIRELLVALALQTGQEVSYNELANTLGMDRKTVERFLDLLEKSFVLFRLYPFSRNFRSELNRKVKMYFYDLGVRHALINNFNPLGMRNDSGPILENYFIAEKVKAEANLSQKANFFFWRTYERHEIDLISEKNGQISAFEIQIKGKPRPTARAIFQAAYPASRFHPVTLDNFSEYLSSPRER